MKTSKLVSILSTFTTQEVRAFKLFVKSPYFNQNDRLTQLLDLLIPGEIWDQSSSLGKADLHQQLFPGQGFVDKRMRYLFTDLSRLAEQFLLEQFYCSRGIQQQLDLAHICNERKLPKLYRQLIRKMEDHFSNQVGRDVRYFEQRLAFAMVKEEQFQQQRLRKFDENLQWVSDDLDRYYFLQKLRQACMMMDRQAILTANYELGISAAWLQHLAAQSFFGELIVEIYHTILLSALEEEDESHFQRLKIMLTGNTAAVTNTDLADIFRFAINYCARKIRKGKTQYVEEALNLYIAGIESQLFLEDDYLSPWTFTNVIKLALRLERFAWIADFIPTYAPSLPPKFQENALHYNYAELYYYTKDLDNALLHLNQVAFEDLNYSLGARVLLAKIYYETDEESALLSLLAAFSVFLKRNKHISSDIKRTYLNFCDLLFQVVRRNSKKILGLRRQIEETELLTDRTWLLSVYEGVARKMELE